MNRAQATRGSALVIALVITTLGFLVTLAVPPPGGKGASWLAPKTWFNHKPADKVDAALKDQSEANQAQINAMGKQIHAASIEADKANTAASKLPPSLAASVTQRFTGNTLSLLSQVSPVTVEEKSTDNSIILGLLSDEIEKRSEAEKKQHDAEERINLISNELVTANNHKKESDIKLTAVQSELRSAFEDRNALANELETARAKHIILIVAVVIALGLVLYLRSSLRGAGAALNAVKSTLGQDTFNKVVPLFDSEMDKIGQKIVNSGRQAAKAAEDKAKDLISPQTPTS